MKFNPLLIGIFWLFIGHVAVFFQLNGQFKWRWFRKNEVIIAACGIFISFFYIWGIKYVVKAFDGLIWPSRFIGFTIGIIIYTLGVSFFFKEGITSKTLVSLVLCGILLTIQVFWKN